MTKIKTVEHLQEFLDNELAWRRKELVIVKSLVTARSSMEITNCHIRAGIALIYAHWEGFIKAAGSAYLIHIASQKLTYAELTNNFVAIATKKVLHDAKESNKIATYTRVVELFTSGFDGKCIIPTEIETKSISVFAILSMARLYTIRKGTYCLQTFHQQQSGSSLVGENQLKLVD